jgi:hypothetical protein
MWNRIHFHTFDFLTDMTKRTYIREFLVQISAEKPCVLIEVFRGFSETLQATARIVPQLGHYHFLPNSSQIIIHQIGVIVYTSSFVK